MHVVIAPDSFGGTLRARQAAQAIAAGWADARPDDVLSLVPMSDGGEGLLDVVAGPGDAWHETEVSDPLGHPRAARWLLRQDGVAVIESAEACGLHLVPAERRSPLHTSTFGVGQLLDAARLAGAARILVGLGGSATVEGGAGALSGLGFRLCVADGSGLKVGGADLHRVTSAAWGWAADWSATQIIALADVRTPLLEAPAVFGPQKGASPEDIDVLREGLAAWADVAERDLAGGRRLRELPGSGAAGGLGFGLAAGPGAQIVDGAQAVAALVGLPDRIERCHLVVTGEGTIDASSATGKVLGGIVAQAGQRPVLAVAGRIEEQPDQLADAEAGPEDATGDAASAVRAAARRLAARVVQP